MFRTLGAAFDVATAGTFDADMSIRALEGVIGTHPEVEVLTWGSRALLWTLGLVVTSGGGRHHICKPIPVKLWVIFHLVEEERPSLCCDSLDCPVISNDSGMGDRRE